MNSVSARATEQPRLYDTYAELFGRLLGCTAAFGFYDGGLQLLQGNGRLQAKALDRWLAGLAILAADSGRKVYETQLDGPVFAVALTMRDSKGRLMGVVAVQLAEATWVKLGSKPASVVATRLSAGLPILFRELSTAAKTSSRTQVLSERTQELEWLFGFTTRIGTNSGDDESVKALLVAGCERLGAAFGAIVIPEKRISIVHAATSEPGLAESFALTSGHLLTWVQRREKPLVVNSPPQAARGMQLCRMMAVPVIQPAGRVIGLIAFFNPMQAPEFASRHTFLGRHLGRQAAAMLETQFDLATGLYTRTALEQQFGRGGAEAGPEGSVIYVDIDRLHLVNEVHGFEIGDEVIVRVADLLSPPLIPENALAARVSGDRFAVVLRDAHPDIAVSIAMALQRAASQISMGTADQKAEISLSCGVAALMDIPQALPRALAAAELACKTAKDRGRGRVEVYATADSSMMRRQDDVMAVGRLRAALKADRMVLYAQKIASLKHPDKACGYEILVRMRDEDGQIVSPAEFISAAQRYQLLPSLDRWVVDRALRQLAPFSGMLLRDGISMSINVSGQSLGDAAFMQRFTDQLAASGVAPGNITVEITEQTAVSNMAHAIEMVRRLRQLGCRIALDDFGTGVNSLTYLKGFPVTRVKIDGSFVRDILTSTRSEETVKAIVQLAKGMDIDTVAEFVENDLIARKVRSLGIDYAQGYAFGKPEPLEDVLRAVQQAEVDRPHRFEFDI